jgi:hypothetical protein
MGAGQHSHQSHHTRRRKRWLSHHVRHCHVRRVRRSLRGTVSLRSPVQTRPQRLTRQLRHQCPLTVVPREVSQLRPLPGPSHHAAKLSMRARIPAQSFRAECTSDSCIWCLEGEQGNGFVLVLQALRQLPHVPVETACSSFPSLRGKGGNGGPPSVRPAVQAAPKAAAGGCGLHTAGMRNPARQVTPAPRGSHVRKRPPPGTDQVHNLMRAVTTPHAMGDCL